MFVAMDRKKFRADIPFLLRVYAVDAPSAGQRVSAVFLGARP